MSCHHRHVVVIGNHETGASSAHCGDCRAPLTRRAEDGEYVYFVLDDQDNGEVVSANKRPAP